MTYVLLIAALVALAYQTAAVIAVLRHIASSDPPGEGPVGISVLKPLRGRDPHFYRAIRSHALQAHPSFELLFGVSDPGDPSVGDVKRLAAEFPDREIRLVRSERDAPNPKVAVLEDLAAEARHPILLVNDSDITVPPDYLRRVSGPLESDQIGLVTCLYRATADHLPGRFEALGIASDFAPGVLVAPLAGVREFGLGSTLVFRARQLREIGGFAAIREYLADDYQLARRITQLGARVHLSKTVVETSLSGSTWSEVWRHQVRWHRTIRVSKRMAYWGITITQATLWGALAAAAGWWEVGLATFGVRLAAGLLTGVGVLKCRITGRLFWLIPVRDLFGVAVWLAGLFGETVEWRGRKLQLTPDGRIRRQGHGQSTAQESGSRKS